MRLSNQIIKPLVTEKNFELANENKYVFEVNMKSTKGSVAMELKKLFGVDAVSVRTVVLPGKVRRIIGTRKFSKSPKWKKAIVKIKEGQKIELFPKD
jgi:large subunit ribosomal protein L23